MGEWSPSPGARVTQMWVLLGESTGVKTPFCPRTRVCVCVY